MARMLPDRLSPEVKSSAEKRVFEWFKNDPDTEGWVVLHSLGLARHQKLLFGEVDFVVLAPEKGVFCLEVKGGRVGREDGVWTFTNRFGETNRKVRGPFEQAREGMFALIHEVKRRLSKEFDSSCLLFGYGAIFPDIEFDIPGPDYDMLQVWDRLSAAQFKISDFIQRLSDYTQRNQVRLFGEGKRRKYPTCQQVKQIANTLRGDFDRPVLLSVQMEEADRGFASLTAEQFRCLDMFEDNKRVLFEGSAGTGKTLLAVEMARRAIDAKERVALFCFNVGLAEWLKEQFGDSVSKGSFIGTFHSYMFACSGVCPRAYPASFFEKELPALILNENLLSAACFDRIIIDEAQDLVCENYLLVFDVMLRDGLDRGSWTMFGDFSKQAIYQSSKTREDIISLIDNFSTFARGRLSKNCRNTKNIGFATYALSGIKSDYPESAILGPSVIYEQWQTKEEEIDLLRERFRLLRQEGVRDSDIVVLTPKTPVDSVAFQVIPDISTDLKSDGIRLASIASFKGLESRVVILVDCDSYSNKSLYYVGTTRARSLLCIIESERARNQRGKLLKEHIHVR